MLLKFKMYAIRQIDTECYLLQRARNSGQNRDEKQPTPVRDTPQALVGYSRPRLFTTFKGAQDALKKWREASNENAHAKMEIAAFVVSELPRSVASGER